MLETVCGALRRLDKKSPIAPFNIILLLFLLLISFLSLCGCSVYTFTWLSVGVAVVRKWCGQVKVKNPPAFETSEPGKDKRISQV